MACPVNFFHKFQDEILLRPFTYLTKVSGKNIRQKLLMAFNVWMKAPAEKVRQRKRFATALPSILLTDLLNEKGKIRT